MFGSGATVSYYRIQDKGDNKLIGEIYKLHIKNFISILRLLSIFICAYFGIGFILGIYRIAISQDVDTSNIPVLIDWILSLIISLLWLVVAYGGFQAVKVQSRGTSKRFAKALLGCSAIYIVYLIFSYFANFDSYKNHWEKEYGLSMIETIGWMMSYLFIVAFLEGFFVLKARQFNKIITQCILESLNDSKVLNKPLKNIN
ncbi:unnamed protein product [Blepharisma stoltei]|uniref:Uncharacterized protein n=1 Tax=Blepharisma stoltei TaxID=1481888 RepID=A0AAU9JFG3_9CILI|nr:unnamed protein product [Blepharisma stoltei]